MRFFLCTVFCCLALAATAQDLNLQQLDSLLEEAKEQKNYKILLPYAQQGLDKVKVEQPQSIQHARMLYFVGLGHQVRQAYILAEEHYLQATALQQKLIPNHPHYAASLKNLGILYLDMSRYHEAEFFITQALAIQLAHYGKKHLEYASTLNNLANVYNKMQRYGEAEPLYRESTLLRKELLGSAHQTYATSLSNLAVLYQKMERFGEAEKLYEELIAIRAKTNGVQSGAYAAALHNLASLYNRQEQYPKAELLYRQALGIQEKTLGKDHPEYLNCLNNLGQLYLDKNELEQAKLFLVQAAQGYLNTFGARSLNYIHTLNSLVSLCMKQRDEANTLIYLQEAIALNIGQKLNLDINRSWANTLAAAQPLSIVHLLKSLTIVFLLHKEDKAKRLLICEAVLELLKKQRNEFLNESDKLRSLDLTADWVLHGLFVLDPEQQFEQAFDFAEQSKSVLLLEAAKAEQAYHFGDLPDSVRAQERKLQVQYEQFQAALLERRPELEKDSLRAKLNGLNLQIKQFKEGLQRQYPKYTALKYAQKEASAKEIQGLLPAKTALVEYVLSDSMVYIFYLDGQQQFFQARPFAPKKLRQELQGLQSVLSQYPTAAEERQRNHAQYLASAHWLYVQLVQPFEAKAKGIEHLIIIPDDQLSFIPFEALLTEAVPPSGDMAYRKLPYLLRRYAISYDYSASLWKNNLERGREQRAGGQMLAMAAHYVQTQASRGSQRLSSYQKIRASLSDLPAAQTEVKALQARFQGGFFFGEAATEGIFKQQAANYGIIHLAMHGLLDQRNPILSSLAFTEDGDSIENNFLQAYEISKMQLSAHLVVLSACETGYGKFERGNGTASLARAFLYAGVPALVVSLWQVNDASTAYLMARFYDHLAQGKDKAQALRQAKLDYLDQMDEEAAAHPSYWAAFVQLGDSSPIAIQTRRQFPWLYLGLGGLGVLAIWWYWRRRGR